MLSVLWRQPSRPVEGAYRYEPIIEDWTEELEQRGLEQTKIWFTGFGAQGDGACFEARIN